MDPSHERRKGDRRIADDELSPEALAVLVVCGGAVRSSDRTDAVDASKDYRRGRRNGDPVHRGDAGAR